MFSVVLGILFCVYCSISSGHLELQVLVSED